MAYQTNFEKIKESHLSFSVILETENLGMAGMDDLKDTLASLVGQTYPIQDAREVIVIAAGHISDETIEFLRVNYPWLTIHRESQKLEYMQSKKRGAEIATGDIVIYADSDVVYEPTWLGNILYGFIAAPGATIVAGETRIRGTSIYSTAIQLVWMMDAMMAPKNPKHLQHFDLNNFAIKRSVMLSAPVFLHLPIYRASTVEMRKQLYALGYSAVQVPYARGYHLPPGNFWDWWYRMLIYGADAVSKADFYFLYGGIVVEKFSPFRRLMRLPLFFGFKAYKILFRIRVLLQEDWKNIFKIIIAIPLAFVFLMIMMLGLCIALISRDFLFNRITARENAHVV